MDISIDYSSVFARIGASSIKILLIIVAVIIARIVLKKMVPKLLALGEKRAGESGEAVSKRIDTLGSVIANTITFLMYAMAGLMVLSEIGINIVPLLTGAGLLGLAFGFGAQNAVRDLIAGFFILMENQYRKGDVIKAAGTSGFVEDVNLRRTVVRDLDGVVHSIPNGEITVTSNLTLGFSRVNLNIPVSYETDLDKAIKVLNKVGRDLMKDKKFSKDITKAPVVWGVDKFADSAIEIKYVGETKPMKQWDVAREIRKRVKIAFDKEKIEIPYPHRVIIQH